MKNIFDDKKILITGNTGFKGAWLTLYLNKICNAELIGFADKFNWREGIFNNNNSKDYIKQYWGDIKNFNIINSIVSSEKPDIIFHLAAQPLVSVGYENPKDTFDVNITGTVNLLESLKCLSKTVFILVITSDKVYKNTGHNLLKEESKLGGICPYSASKACIEIVTETYSNIYKNKYINSARAGNVLGGGDWSKDRIIPDIIKSFLDNKPLRVRNPNAERPWSYVLDVIRGYLLIIENMVKFKRGGFESFNFAADIENKSVKEITSYICKEIKYSNEVIYDPLFVGKEAQAIKLSNNKSKEVLNWYPIYDFDNTLKYTTKWYKDFCNKYDVLDTAVKLLNKYLTDLNNENDRNINHHKRSYKC